MSSGGAWSGLRDAHGHICSSSQVGTAAESSEGGLTGVGFCLANSKGAEGVGQGELGERPWNFGLEVWGHDLRDSEGVASLECGCRWWKTAGLVMEKEQAGRGLWVVPGCPGGGNRLSLERTKSKV